MNELIRWTQTQKAEVLQAMEFLLADARMNSSRRCVLMLRFLVEHSLSGDLTDVKERRLGMEVFGRPAEYDTNDDPIVRVTASEIRKRLTRIYSEMPQPPCVRIHLNAGSYVPVYEFVEKPACADAPALPQAAPSAVTESKEKPLARSSHTRFWLWGTAACLLLAIAIAVSVRMHPYFQLTHQLIWSPFLSKSRTVLVCAPSSADAWSPNASQTLAAYAPDTRAVAFQEANTAYKLARRLTLFGQPSSFCDASGLTLTDFHKSPVVLIGGFDNPWSMKMLSKLRYQIAMDPASGQRWIRDAQTSTQPPWKLTNGDSHLNLDYALVTRYWNPEAGGWVMIFSGLGASGTESAADLVSAAYLRSLLPRELRTAHNFQIVIAVPLENHAIGAPRILATHIW